MDKTAGVLKRIATILLLGGMAWPQQMSKLERQDTQEMLRIVAAEVHKHYYDTKLHGVDFDAKVAEARLKIDKDTSLGMAFSRIASALETLDDSHTYFVPPQRSYRYDYGIDYQMVGDWCMVTEVRPHSDAEAKGVKPGDQILTLNGYAPTRDTLSTIQYIFRALRPQPSLRLNLQDPSGAKRDVEVNTKFHEKKIVTDLTGAAGAGDIWNLIREGQTEGHLMRARTAELGDQIMVLKLPAFDFNSVEVDNMIQKARKHQALIIDLRGNGAVASPPLNT